MKARCPYSGVVYTTSATIANIPEQSFSDIFVAAPHPIFYLSQKKLTGIAAGMLKTTPSQIEAKLLSLALLKSTGLVEFHQAGEPNYSTSVNIITGILDVLPLIDMYKRIEDKNYLYLDSDDSEYDNKSIRIPRFSINKETSDLTSVSEWFSDIKLANANRAKIDNFYRIGADVNHITERLINSTWATPKEKAAVIAQYLKQVMMSDPTISKSVNTVNYARNRQQTNIVVYYTDIIKASAENIHQIRDKDIDDLEYYVMDKIPVGTVQSHAILSHIRSIKANKNLSDECATILLRTIYDKHQSTISHAVMEVELAIDTESDIIDSDNPDDIIPVKKAASESSPSTIEMPDKPNKLNFASPKLYFIAHAHYLIQMQLYKDQQSAQASLPNANTNNQTESI